MPASLKMKMREKYTDWAYKPERVPRLAMELPEASIFGLTWKNIHENKCTQTRTRRPDTLTPAREGDTIAEFLDSRTGV